MVLTLIMSIIYSMVVMSFVKRLVLMRIVLYVSIVHRTSNEPRLLKNDMSVLKGKV